jgi:MFS family permease
MRSRSRRQTETEEPIAALPRGAFVIVFCVSLAVAVGNTGMQSVLPAIGRSIQIPDFMVAAIYSLSALLWAFSSPWWARRSDVQGRKPLMLIGLGGFAVSMTLCALVVGAGLLSWSTPMVIFVLFLLSRAIFGFFGAAAPPASQAYVAERTTRDQRTQAMATLAGAFGLGTIVGPVIAPLFILPVEVGLAGPMLGFGLIAVVVFYVVVRYLPEERIKDRAPIVEPGEDASAEPADSPRKPLWRDTRVAPFLVYGFLMATTQTAQIQTLGFLVIDKLALPPMQAQGYIMVAMAAGAVAGLLAQWGLIRMFNMGPRHLLRWGVGLAALGNLVVAFAPQYGAVVVGYAIASLGFGFARPGFTAGASLAVTMNEQARAAGAIGAVFGANVILAPLFVLLYEQWGPAPFLLNTAINLALLAYCFRSRSLLAAGVERTSDEVVAAAQLERGDEGSP